MGVSGFYTIRRCTLGYMGVNAIGRGELRVEDSTLHGWQLVCFRGDYGSTWEGDVFIKNCRWIPACGDETWPTLFATSNDGTHDFGYPCFMPQSITIDGLHVEDAHTPEGYTGPFIFTDPDDGQAAAGDAHPYQRCKAVSIKGFSSASAKAPRVSANEGFASTLDFQITV